MAASKNVGQALEWVRAVFGVTWDAWYDEAFAVPPGAEGVRFLPYVTGERAPVFDPRAAGAWTGLRSDHGRGHLLRAALEGVAFALGGCLDALAARGVCVDEVLLAGGGSTDPRWRQLLADVTGARLLEAPAVDASARGAALLAGLATGQLAMPQPAIRGAVLAAPGSDQQAYAAMADAHGDLYRRLRQRRRGDPR